MENYNNGERITFNEITDYQKAAKDFSEGNKDLEQLCLTCFEKRIPTVSCCSGDHMPPYFAFEVTKENIPYLKNVMNTLKDHGYEFSYNKAETGPSYFGVHERENFDSSKETTLFQEIKEVLCKEKEKPISNEVESYFQLIHSLERDSLEGNTGIFQMIYLQDQEDYQCTVTFCSPNYAPLVAQSGFKINPESAPFLMRDVVSKDPEDLAKVFQNLATAVKPKITLDPLQMEALKEDISFVYDEKVRENPLINHLNISSFETLETVAAKLKICKDQDINAFAIFNGKEINNYQEDTIDGMIDQYLSSTLEERSKRNSPS